MNTSEECVIKSFSDNAKRSHNQKVSTIFVMELFARSRFHFWKGIQRHSLVANWNHLTLAISISQFSANQLNDPHNELYKYHKITINYRENSWSNNTFRNIIIHFAKKKKNATYNEVIKIIRFSNDSKERERGGRIKLIAHRSIVAEIVKNKYKWSHL